MTASKLILFALGATPVYLVIFASRPRTALMVAFIYLIGWGACLAARRRDPEERALRVFTTSSHGKATVFGAAVLVQWLALSLTGTKALVAALVILVCSLLLWATARSAEELHHYVARTQLVFGSVVLSLIALELALHVIDSRRPPNDFRTITWGHEVRNSSLGFRERELESPKPPGTFRVMVVGDSLTWGAGLPVGKRYSNLLEERLKVMIPGKAIEVLNFGIRGGPTVQQRDIVFTHIKKTDPDLIVVGFCVNDPQPKSQNYAVELERFQLLFAALHDLGRVGLTKTSGFLRDRTDRLLRNAGLVPSWPEALNRTYVESSSEWKAFEAALRDIMSLSNSRSLPAPIFVPLLQGTGDFDDPDAFLERILKWCRQAADTARKVGFMVVSVEDAFKLQGFRDRSVNPWDNHPSAECNEIYAQEIANAIAPLISGNLQLSSEQASLTWLEMDAIDG